MGVAVVHLAGPSEDHHVLANLQVLGHVIVLSPKRHAGAVSKDGLFGKLLALKEHWEGVTAGILLVDFLNLNGVIAQEEVQSIELLASVVAVIVPPNGEREHVAVVLNETVQVLVGTSALKHNFDIVLMFSQIRRVLLEVDHSTGVGKLIIWESLCGSEVTTLV